MVKLEESKKNQILMHFDDEVELADSSKSFTLLNPLKNDNENLYKIGCKLDHYYKNKEVINVMLGPSYSVSDTEYCGFLNEWLNREKIDYISSGSKCEGNIKLWEEYIEVLWKQLEKDIQDSYSCERNTTIYKCSISHEMKTALSVGFTLLGTFLITFYFLYKFSPIGPRIHSCRNKKKRITKNIVLGESCELLERYSENVISPTEDGRIRIGYNSAGN
ncbi:PIR protein [Plasmodium malariae]|uniref:PIR protein n=1 Tax=Plasmodium malariae TaxID=5858 RepID=A0A1D3JGY7_PLAMA|nr:PIR protein [Plasmodium malariae]SBT85539.1 PIR protein [Plasmodium malariae]